MELLRVPPPGIVVWQWKRCVAQAKGMNTRLVWSAGYHCYRATLSDIVGYALKAMLSDIVGLPM